MVSRERLLRLAGTLVIVFSFTVGWLWMGVQTFASSSLNLPEQGAVYEVPPGSHLGAIARDLHEQGLIERPKYFVWLARLRGDARSIQAGEYDLTPGITVGELLDRFVSGKVYQYAFTILEGWTFRDLRAAMANHEKFRHTLTEVSDAEIMAKLGMPGEHPEGWFYPDTYHFPRGTTDLAFLKRANRAMRERLEQEWAKRSSGLPYDTPYEALIMASIVEKETAVPEERSRIAGVFVRRLEKRMRLQTDPTVIYGLGDKYTGNLRRSDLKRDNPYNTYRRRGLTPTPIAMPGGEAIHAALHPDEGEALYFVAKGDGSHHFSATVEEHNRAVRKYQVVGRTQDYRSTPVADGASP